LFEQNGVRAAWGAVNAPSNNFTRTQSYVGAGQINLLDNLIALTGGLRRDEAFISETNYVRDARGLFSAGAHGGTRAVEDRSVGRPYLFGVVLHAHRNVSLFYNESTNYKPGVNSARTIADDFLPPLEGQGFDTGVRLSALGGKLAFTVDYFETQQKNFRDPTLSGSKTSWINAIWTALDPNRRLPSGWTDTKAQETRGLEFQVVANPTKRLRLMVNASHNNSFLLDHGGATFAYLAANYPLWESRATTRVTHADGNTVGALVTRIRQEESDDRRIIGIEQTRVFTWQANAVGRYQFDGDTPLKGFGLGAAARWREAPVIGFLRAGTLLDPTRPIRGQATTNLDAWLDYERSVTLGGRKLRWSAQLRVQNVFDDRTLQPWTADDDGTGQARIQTRRTPGARMVALSSTLSF
jgi:outer membrane receptor for ferric coprogen and ferric-rhodotorulic acid